MREMWFTDLRCKGFPTLSFIFLRKFPYHQVEQQENVNPKTKIETLERKKRMWAERWKRKSSRKHALQRSEVLLYIEAKNSPLCATCPYNCTCQIRIFCHINYTLLNRIVRDCKLGPRHVGLDVPDLFSCGNRDSTPVWLYSQFLILFLSASYIG